MASSITVLLMVLHCISANIYLEKLSTLYLPYKYENINGTYGYDKLAVEQFTYDADNQIVYTIVKMKYTYDSSSYTFRFGGDLLILVIDVSNVTTPVILYHKTMPNTKMKDIEVCGDYVILARVDDLRNEHGIVEIYGKYDNKTKDLPFKRVIQVGKNPDTLCPTSDCQTILVTLEADAYPNLDNTKMIDPPGGVGIIKFPTADLSKEPSFKFADFASFNDRWQEFVAKGVRYIYRENGNSFANDLEPEGITLNADETIAYVALQTNNAIAELNLNTGTFTNIYPLGYKDWRNYKLDVSDKDNKINIRPWPVYGMYQPDALTYFVLGGQGYIISANEGATKNYADDVTNGFNEVSRVKDLTFADNSTILRWAAKNNFTNTSLKAEENIGRLIVSNIEGRMNGTNITQYDALYAFGARSFSIWRIDASGVVNVYDSGSDLEDTVQRLRPDLFNSDSGNADSRLNDTKGKFSSKMGPSPEMVTTGQYKGKTLLFASCEEPGMVFVYSIGDDVTKPRFESMWAGIPKSNSTTYNTWGDLYDQRQLSEIDPEDMRFIEPAMSPNKQPILMVIGSTSGTFSIFQIKDNGISGADRTTWSFLLFQVVLVSQIVLYFDTHV